MHLSRAKLCRHTAKLTDILSKRPIILLYAADHLRLLADIIYFSLNCGKLKKPIKITEL